MNVFITLIGGLKVWECSVDLCRFLASVIEKINNQTEIMNDDDGEAKDLDYVTHAVRKSISSGGLTLELGCGHGLPGCLVLRENIRNTLTDDKSLAEEEVTLVFTDFNDFVLQNATIPNAQINVSGLRRSDGVGMDECSTAQSLLRKSVFVGGDWMGLLNLLRDNHNIHTNDCRFDLILAAETTYTQQSCQDTAYLMAKHLRINTGVGLIATKRFYFGVGGGTDMLSDAIKLLNTSSISPYSNHLIMMRTIKSYDTGNANIRDLIEVRCVTKDSIR